MNAPALVNSCPKEKFVHDHVCGHCNDSESALGQYSKTILLIYRLILLADKLSRNYDVYQIILQQNKPNFF